MPITAADLLNDRALPLYDEHEVKPQRVLTDRGTGFCGNPERHEYQLHLTVEDIDRTRTPRPRARRPTASASASAAPCSTSSAARRSASKVYRAIDEPQANLDAWTADYNESRPHEGRWCYGKTPMRTFLDAAPLAGEKIMHH